MFDQGRPLRNRRLITICPAKWADLGLILSPGLLVAEKLPILTDIAALALHQLSIQRRTTGREQVATREPCGPERGASSSYSGILN